MKNKKYHFSTPLKRNQTRRRLLFSRLEFVCCKKLFYHEKYYIKLKKIRNQLFLKFYTNFNKISKISNVFLFLHHKKSTINLQHFWIPFEQNFLKSIFWRYTFNKVHLIIKIIFFSLKSSNYHIFKKFIFKQVCVCKSLWTIYIQYIYLYIYFVYICIHTYILGAYLKLDESAAEI